ncbi:MAG: DCC1-like thiol-disulfide oxidoreductase family protein [Gammaproteobacteria bacterium]
MSDDQVMVVYDKQCPACNYYCNMVRIRATAGELVLIDARDGGPVLDEITAHGLDIDQGMVVKVGSELYYGPDAIHVLALMGTNRGLFNRMAYWTFRSRAAARIVYPILKACRNLLLKILGKTRINNLGITGNDRF